MSTIQHPRIPLAAEQREAILALNYPATSSDLSRVRAEFNERRDQEFPGWREIYDAEVKQWANKMGACA